MLHLTCRQAYSLINTSSSCPKNLKKSVYAPETGALPFPPSIRQYFDSLQPGELTAASQSLGVLAISLECS